MHILHNKSRLPSSRAQSFRLLFGTTIALTIAWSALVLPLPARAAGTSYVVNSFLDEPDADVSNGICSSSPSGVCTLRAAIMEANFATGPNTITVPSGTFILTRSGALEDGAIFGDLDILHDMTIQGAGSGATIVDGNGGVTGDRVFHVLSSATFVTMTGMTIQNGTAITSTSAGDYGGGIDRDGNCSCANIPSLNLSDMIFYSNTARYGGGIYTNAGLVTLKHVTFNANVASSGGGLNANGGGLTIQDSLVYSNTALLGGGIHLLDIDNGQIVRTEFYSNTATVYGGAMHNDATAFPSSRVTLLDSSLHNNHAVFNGGAIDNYSALVISRTVLDSNWVGQYGGAIMVPQTNVPSAMVIDQSTLSRNSSQYGGAIFYTDFCCTSSDMTLSNSTLSGNTATHEGGGIYALAGAHLSLFNATISDNRAFRQTGTYSVRGGGLFITTTALITAQNTLIGNNVTQKGAAIPTPDDCFGPLVSLGYNLVETTTNCIISGTTVGNVTGQDPQLGPLQNNGGPTKTQALLVSSPAIDAGNNGSCAPRDQRGFKRPYPAAGTCDIGAFERVASLFLPLILR